MTGERKTQVQRFRRNKRMSGTRTGIKHEEIRESEWWLYEVEEGRRGKQ